MKKSIFIIALCAHTSYSMQSQFNRDFVHRFGPNSPIYNTPLYFGEARDYHVETPQKRIRKSYRVRLKEKKEKAKRRTRLKYEKPI